MPHVVLLGDSIFDNGAYTNGDLDVVACLRAILPSSWKATLCAVDGSTASHLPSQLPDVPRDATHLVISMGGNDALLNGDLLTLPVASSAEVLTRFHDRIQWFEAEYRKSVRDALSLGRNTALCTIYNGNLPPEQAVPARIALMLFNDVIVRFAFERRLMLIDLRLICVEPADYANPIEPSTHGARKIARAIARCVGALGEAPGGTEVIAE